MLLAVIMTLSSCLSSDESTTVKLYPDMAITSFTLGTMNRYVPSKSVYTGKDTILKSTYTGSLYQMTIDHIGQKIYNAKPLPTGTDVSHVICTIETKNSGVVYLKRIASDSLFYHQTSDSVDLSVPRTFRVFATDGSGSRDYTVTLTTGDSSSGDFSWVRTDSIEQPSSFDTKHLVMLGDTIRLADQGTVVKGDQAFRLNGGLTEQSADLEQWTATDGATANPQLSMLIGSSTTELFALGTDGQLKRSIDDGRTWQDEQLDEDAALLPTQNITTTCWSYAPDGDADYVLMVGNDPANTTSMSVWRKISPHKTQGQWVYMTPDEVNPYQLPRTEQLSLANFEGTVLATGSDMKIYQSRDQGISWQQPATFALPNTLTGTAVLMTADANDHVWIVTSTGEIWEGARR